MKYSRRELGLAGEALAREYLIEHGLHIIDTNWRDGRNGELDIIAADLVHECYVVVEVRTRVGNRCGSALASVDWRKYRQLRLLAISWLSQQKVRRHIRIDVVAVSIDRAIRELPDLSVPFAQCVSRFADIHWEQGVSL